MAVWREIHHLISILRGVNDFCSILFLYTFNAVIISRHSFASELETVTADN
jgi:hypothetical protein